MPWLQLTFDSNAQHAEALSEHLLEFGAVSVTLTDGKDQPVYEPALNTTPVWDNTQVTALFDENHDVQQLHQHIAELTPTPFYHTETLQDQDWVRVCLADFHPMQFGQNIWVCPSWEKVVDENAVNIYLDPGLAFGTGTHPTTALCLQWLDSHPDLSGQTWIDYGCGSGILAIAAAKLGAKKIWAVDNDPQALIATRDNAIKNKVSDKIITVLPEDLPSQQADGLLANILANPLLQLANTLSRLLHPQAPIILSGILADQATLIQDQYTGDFNQLNTQQQAGWIRIAGIKS